MKKILLSFFGFAAALSLTLTSCADPCKDVNCNNGECVEGDCVCTDGWEGTDCLTEWSDKFVSNNANATDLCTSGSYSYTVDILAVNESTIQIINLGDFNTIATVTATIADGNELVINVPADGAGRQWVGSGVLNGNTLTINYVVTFDDGTFDTCTATLSI
jgi:hypothetical protein